jgi:TPP-dependent pyruvate/acetoin dehydrogenase alpha subunit
MATTSARASHPRTRRPALVAAADPVTAALQDADRVRLLRFMLQMRLLEERGLKLYKQGKVPGSFYDGRGQEAVSVGATYALDAGDALSSPLIRDLGAHLVRGTDLADILRHHMGRQGPLSHGREGNVHFGDRHLGVVGMVSMLPDMMVVANGLALAFKLRGEQRCALSFFGDGATSRGDWHEAMNWAAIDRLPVVFVLESNGLAYSTPAERQFRVAPVQRAAGYGIPAQTVDGNDVEAVFQAVAAARVRALAGDGPTLVEAVTMRMHGHGAHDDARYVDPGRLDEWARRDPIEHQTAAVAGLVDVDALRAEVLAEVDAAAAAALATPMADPADALIDVFCDGEPEPLGTAGQAPWSGFGAVA